MTGAIALTIVAIIFAVLCSLAGTIAVMTCVKCSDQRELEELKTRSPHLK